MAIQLLVSLTGKKRKRINAKLALKKYANSRKGMPGFSIYFPLFSFLLGNPPPPPEKEKK